MIIDSMAAQACVSIFFLTTVILHITKKNQNEAALYGAQSLSVVVLLALSLIDRASVTLLLVTLLMFTAKVVLAPRFLIRLVRHHQAKFTASTYLNTPGIMLVITLILLLTGSGTFASLTQIIPGHRAMPLLALASILISLFLIINRKGVISQAVGVLSLENSILLFAALAGLEQSPVLQLGIVFDITVWFVISTMFVSMIYRHFGSLDVTNMKKLKG